MRNGCTMIVWWCCNGSAFVFYYIRTIDERKENAVDFVLLAVAVVALVAIMLPGFFVE
jgi:hypothetical protein